MKALENINIPQPVTQFCDIFEIELDQLVQSFLDHIDMVSFFTKPFDSDRWANLFVMECAVSKHRNGDILERYAVLVDQIANYLLTAHRDDHSEAVQKLVDQWQHAVLEGRIQEIMKRDQ